MGEVGHAAAGMSRADADRILTKIVAEYEPHLDEKPFGKPFEELYDVTKVRPNAEWLTMYDKVKETGGGWGLNFK